MRSSTFSFDRVQDGFGIKQVASGLIVGIFSSHNR